MKFRDGDRIQLSGANYYSMQKELIAHKENKTIGTVILVDYINSEYVIDFDSSTFRIKKQYIAPAPGFKL